MARWLARSGGGSAPYAVSPSLRSRWPRPSHPRSVRILSHATPATRALLSVEDFDGSIWEPACGEGHISSVLVKAGYDVISTDLIQRGYGEGDVDFLRQTVARGKHIVTNPPYGRGLGDAFVRKALELTAPTGGTVAMLLNLASLCHPTRHFSP